MKLHLFHTWEKWGAVKYEEWLYITKAGKPFKVVKQYQERTCAECGLSQKRYVENK